MKRLFALLLILLLFACGNLSVAKIITPESQFDKSYDFSHIEKAINEGAIALGWRTEKIQDGLIRATLNVRNHVAIADIAYNSTGYTIKYVDSTNLEYTNEHYVRDTRDPSTKRHVEGEFIHPNYNRWVNNLKAKINFYMY